MINLNLHPNEFDSRVVIVIYFYFVSTTRSPQHHFLDKNIHEANVISQKN